MADHLRPRTLEVAHPNAAGIDIGSGSPFVALRADLHEEPVLEFGSFTEDLEAMAGPRAHHDVVLGADRLAAA